MRFGGTRFGGAILITVLAVCVQAERAPAPLTISLSTGQPQVELPQEPIAPVGGTRYLLEIESSADLQNWQSAGEMHRGANDHFVYQPTNAAAREFFRLSPQITDSGNEVSGDELFGFQRAFEDELGRVGFLTPKEFATNHPPSDRYLTQISFDPRTAKF